MLLQHTIVRNKISLEIPFGEVNSNLSFVLSSSISVVVFAVSEFLKNIELFVSSF